MMTSGSISDKGFHYYRRLYNMKKQEGFGERTDYRLSNLRTFKKASRLSRIGFCTASDEGAAGRVIDKDPTSPESSKWV
jgi:hypothetical protein